MLGSMAMQFRSWMPQMVQERFGKLKYDQDLEIYTMGKFNLFFQELFTKRAPSLLSGIISASGTNMIEAAKQKYLLFQIFKLNLYTSTAKHYCQYILTVILSYS